MNLGRSELLSHFNAIAGHLTAISAAKANQQPHQEISDALYHEVARIQPSPEYLGMVDSFARTYVSAVSSSPDNRQIIDNWGQLDAEKHKAPYLQKCANLLAGIMSEISGLKVRPAAFNLYHIDRTLSHSTEAFLGFSLDSFNRNQDNINFNTAYDEWQQDHSCAQRAMFHESLHIFNYTLATFFHERIIAEDHPLHGEAFYFHEILQRKIRIESEMGLRSSPGLNPYMSALDERMTYRGGADVFDRFEAVRGRQVIQNCGFYRLGLEQALDNFVEELQSSEELSWYQDHWSELDQGTQQLPYLQYCIERLALLQENTTGVKVYTARVRYYADPKGFNAAADYWVDNPQTDSVSFNTAPTQTQPFENLPSTNLPAALKRIVYNQVLLFNLSLCRAYHNNGLDENHSLYGPAKSFRHAFMVNNNPAVLTSSPFNDEAQSLTQYAASQVSERFYQALVMSMEHRASPVETYIAQPITSVVNHAAQPH